MNCSISKRFWCAVVLALLLGPRLLVAQTLGPAGLAKFNLSQADLTRSDSAVVTEQVRAELMAWAPDGIAAGKTLWLGLQLVHQPKWHSYWKNPGDSGQPTSLNWSLPAGMQAADIQWPVPQVLPTGDLVTYGLNDSVLLAVPVTVTPDFKPGLLGSEIEVKLQANWLVCNIVCLPQEGQFVLRLPVQGSTVLYTDVFQQALAALPKTIAGSSQIHIDGDRFILSVAGLPPELRGHKLDFFPETANLIEASAPWSQSWHGNDWQASLPISAQRDADVAALPLLLAQDVDGRRLGFATTAAISGSWPAQARPDITLAAPTLAATAMLASTPAKPASVTLNLWLALAAALVGGMLLNLMPCVFPVLAIKVLGFTQHADGRRRAGLAYSVGVVLSFVVLGALMLVLRHAGEQLGWGFQLQQPVVVVALALLFTLIGFNLLGVFELGHVLPSSWATWRARQPTLDAALSGVLAVLIASPCTAPFMALALGLTLVAPPLQALLIFATLGFGMALPYLLLSCSTTLASRLPRPGAWMQTVRRALAFPIFATVVWLLWVLGQQTSVDAVTALLALLLALAFLVWALGLAGRWRRLGAGSALLLLLGLGWMLGGQLQSASHVSANSVDANWQSWAPNKVQAALNGGQPVLVDFTAAWCVTCQYNKKTTLANADLLAALQAKKVLLLRADWTRRDPEIAAALAALGRSGVPVYAFYQPGLKPVLLPELLTTADVRAVLARL